MNFIEVTYTSDRKVSINPLKIAFFLESGYSASEIILTTGKSLRVTETYQELKKSLENISPNLGWRSDESE